MCDRFGAFSHVFYIAPWLQNLGLSFPQAACGSAHLQEETRQAWRPTTWLQMLRVAHAKTALRWFGDAASVPQWGTLTYTWARRGQPPKVKPAGQRNGYTGCGLIDSCTGCCLYQGQEGRLHSTASMALLTRVLKHTPPHIILIQEGAQSHTSAAPQAFFTPQATRLQGVQVPTYAPAYNPMEKLWKKITQQDTHLHYFPTCEALTEKVEQALLKCTNAPDEVRALCGLPTELAQAA
jgi:DDE superfamily endonuclease